MDSLKRIARAISLVFVLFAVPACSLEVRDQTISPARYNSGYDIKAQVRLGTRTTRPELNTSVSIHGISFPIDMERSGVHPQFDYDGKWEVSVTSMLRPSATACGFSVHHVASARFLGLPLKKMAVQQIQGDPSLQGAIVYGADWWGTRRLVHLTSGAALIQTRPIETANGIGLANYHPAPVIVQSVTLVCNGNDCGSMKNPPPPINGITMPSFPVVLNCGQAMVVSFSCTQPAIDKSAGGKARFVTDKGDIEAPFTCSPAVGA